MTAIALGSTPELVSLPVPIQTRELVEIQLKLQALLKALGNT